MNARRWFVMLLVALVWIASTVFIFLHPAEANFAVWATLAATVGGTYHWLVERPKA